MTREWLFAALLCAALGAGMLAGLFFVFSNTIMDALGRQPAQTGAAVMRTINSRIQNPLFFVLFFGTAASCVAVIIGTAMDPSPAGASYALLGAALNLGGSLMVTVACNVPLNHALDRTQGATAEGDAVWAKYLVRWTRWNHVRTVANIASAVLLCLALRMGAA
jgi:uncharacterized membrane protein